VRARSAVRVIGYFLVALIFCGLALTVLTALRDNQPFYGRNVYGLPIGTYSVAAMFAIVLIIGLVWLVQRLWRRAHRD
jgi:hypothetical protein